METKLHRTTLRMPAELHTRAKVLAAQRGESLETIVARALSRYLEQEKRAKARKTDG